MNHIPLIAQTYTSLGQLRHIPVPLGNHQAGTEGANHQSQRPKPKPDSTQLNASKSIVRWFQGRTGINLKQAEQLAAQVARQIEDSDPRMLGLNVYQDRELKIIPGRYV